MSDSFVSALRHASSASDQKQKAEQYRLLLSSVVANSNIADAKAFITHSKLRAPQCTMLPTVNSVLSCHRTGFFLNHSGP